MDLDEVADELYGMAPEGFVARRTELASTAKAEGDPDLARTIAALRKPTVVAWLANQLTRQHPDEVARLVDLGEALREATVGLQGDQLRALSRQRQQVVAAFVGKARAIAVSAGRRLGPETERGLEATVAAALADGEAAVLLQQGRLTEQLDVGDGFLGLAPDVAVAPRPARVSGAPAPAVDDLERQRAQRELNAAQQVERRAEVTSLQAAEALERSARAVAEVEREVGRLTHLLEQAQAAAERAVRDQRDARDRADRTELDLEDARRRRADAEERVRRLDP